MMTTEEMVMYDWIVEKEVATPAEINLVFTCSSWRDWTECLTAILYSRTGYRSIEQYIEAEYPEDWAAMRADVERTTAWMIRLLS